MNKKIYLATGLLLSLVSCAENSMQDEPEIDTQNQVSFSATIAGKTKTRFANPGGLTDLAFTAGDKFVVGIQNNVDGPANFSETSCLRTITVGNGPTFTPNTPLYWDDLGGRETNSYIWGVYTHNTGTPVLSRTIDKTGKFTWTLPTNQAFISDFQYMDLLYSCNKKKLVYTPNPATPTVRDKADLIFEHAMSRIIINVKAGDGFIDADFNNATASLKDEFTTVDVDMLSATNMFTVKSTQADISMHKKASATEGYAASFDAIVAPGKTYIKDTEIATLSVKGNTYKLKATQEFAAALGTEGCLIKGKYYTFNVTLNKTAIGITAFITDWTSGYETPAGSFENAQIVIDTNEKGADVSGTGLKPYKEDFDLFKSNNGIDYDGNADVDGIQPSTQCSYDESTNSWTYAPTLYWQSEQDKAFFRGFNPKGSAFVSAAGDKNIASLVAGDTDYQWGTSGDEKVSPTSGKVNLLFEHKTSQVIVNLKTVTGSAAVNLEGATVEITNTIKDGSIDMHTGNISLGATRETYTMTYKTNSAGIFTHAKFAIPQTLNGADNIETYGNYETSDDAFLKITVNPNDPTSRNVYYFKLNTAEKEGQRIIQWESNKTYIYNITIKKTGISLNAQIKDWVLAFNSDNINIQL